MNHRLNGSTFLEDDLSGKSILNKFTFALAALSSLFKKSNSPTIV
ncbi:MAG: hypothetical protein RBS91_08560 [Sulfurimonadaceae bacterium]|nr:hypothetical protein [Sulfurimonadaceae bacterium]